MMCYPITIIVPIYNVEPYIERCLISLFEQDFEDIEYVFVNDCTLDNSVVILQKIIEKYPSREPHIKLIHHEENKGSGAARRTGVQNATGEYTIQIDADDWCELDMVSLLYAKAKEKDADIVICDYFLSFKNRDIYERLDCSDSLQDNVSSFMAGKLSYLWNKLIRRDLYVDNNIYPPTEISVWEDRWVLTRLFIFATKIAYLPKAFLHYWKENSNSITSNITDKTWHDIRWYVESTKKFLQEQGLYEQYKDLFLTKILFYVLLCSQGKNYKERITYVSPESDKFRYLCVVSKNGIFTKCVFSFYMLNLGFVGRFLWRCKKILKKY